MKINDVGYWMDDNDQLIENKDESNYAKSNTKDHDVDYSELNL